MNLIEIAESLKDLPDQYLFQEVQAPTGNFPTYLVDLIGQTEISGERESKIGLEK